MSNYTDWLAQAAEDLTTDQRETFETRADAYFALPFHAYRDTEDHFANMAEDDYALTAILEDIMEEESLEGAAREFRTAQARLTGWIRGSAARGVSEAQISTRTGLARDTVRKRLGK